MPAFMWRGIGALAVLFAILFVLLMGVNFVSENPVLVIVLVAAIAGAIFYMVRRKRQRNLV